MTTDTTAEREPGYIDCQEAVERLYDYLAGELDDVRRAEIATHLDLCAPCLQAFDFEAELRAVICTRSTEVVPEELRERIRRSIVDPGA